MTKKSITNRWIINLLGVIAIILVVGVLSASFAIKNYYYSSSREYISSRMTIISSILQRYHKTNQSSFSFELKNLVENYTEKDYMEFMVINSKGGVPYSSSGFKAQGGMQFPDYIAAKKSPKGQSYSVSRTPSGEKVMAFTILIDDLDSDYSAVRLVASLEKIDKQIYSFILAITLVCIAFFIFSVVSGMYFIKSIVVPIRQIGESAKKFATGDFSQRIEKKNDDEIGELTDVINYMADELSNNESMKNEFISSVSHELRTPLTGIKGWAETVLEMTDDTETIKKGMTAIAKETDRLSQMVEELLDFSRIQNGRFTLNKTTMDILAELEEAILIYTEKAKRENIEITYNDPQMLPFVFADKNRIRQVFINVIDNAIKYSGPGAVIYIEAISEGASVEISISDTGCGISEADLAKVKTKFFRANHNKPGSGIGLAVANEIISMHDGTLNVLSELGVGTTVVITLPTINKK